MNPVPAFLLAFLAGYYLGVKVGQHAAYEEMDQPLSWEDVQAEVAREGLQ